MNRFIVLAIFFYILILLQTSFLVPLNIGGFVPNLILIAVFLINIFESPRGSMGIFAAFFGGFFLDVFSSGIIGLQALVLLSLSLFIKLILRKYARSPIH